jgi:DNA-binding transcriptional LysR family regulator
MHFDLIDIELFVNIAETMSLTRGAERSHMSAPAASARIKTLESRLGTSVLYRTTRGVALSPAGHAFLRRGRLMLQQAEFLAGDLQEHTRSVRGHVRIAAGKTTISEYLPAVLRAYLAKNPDAIVDVHSQSGKDTVRAVQEGSADVGIVTNKSLAEGLELLPFRRDPVVLVTSQFHPLSCHQSLDFEASLEYNYVGYLEDTTCQTFLQKTADSLNKELKTRVNVSTYETVCRMVEDDIGVSIMAESIARRHAETMAIKVIPLNDEWARLRTSTICVRSLKLIPAPVMQLIEMLRADGASKFEQSFKRSSFQDNPPAPRIASVKGSTKS